MKRLNQTGLSHVLTVLGVAVLVAVGLIGWKVAHTNTTTDSIGNAAVKTTAVPKTISSTNDLNQAERALNSTNVDNDVNPDSLNSDLNAL